MRPTTKLLLIGAAFLLASHLNAQTNYAQGCEVENNAIQIGEELVYKVYYNLDFLWIPAGEVTFRVRGDEEQIILRAEGSTFPSYEWFYKVDDEYETVLDGQTLLPVYAHRKLKEGGYRLYEEVDFDYSNNTAHVVRGRDKEQATDRGDFNLSTCSTDLLSLLFRLRNLDREAFMEQGEIELDFFLGKDEYNVPMKYIKTERKKIKGLGRYHTIKVSPQLVAGDVFKEGDSLVAWVSDDENRVPLMIESPLSVGSAKAVLKSYRGLKYPLGG